MTSIDASNAHAMSVQSQTKRLTHAISAAANDGKLNVTFDVDKYYTDYIEQFLTAGSFAFKKKEGKLMVDRFYIRWHQKGHQDEAAV